MKTEGFTLLELLLATVLVVLGVMAIVTAMSSGVNTDNSIDGRVVALKLAQEEIETVKNSPNTTYSYIYNNYGTYSSEIYTPVVLGTPFSQYTNGVQVTNPLTGLTQVTVNVTWDFKSNPLQVSLVTLIADTST